MSVTSNRPKYLLISGSLVMVCLALTACTGGSSTLKVNRADGQGSKVVQHEADQDGQSTNQSAQDSKAKRQQSAQEMAEQLKAKKAEQLDISSRAPKRKSNAPIYVNLAPLVLDDKMRQAEKSKGAVEQQIRSEFNADPIIKLIEENRGSSDKGDLRAGFSIADVEVVPKVSIKDVYVLQPKTGKPGKMVAVVFEATITSEVPPVTSTVSETGHVLENVEVSKRFVTQIKEVILEKIGPGIPAH
ncbi:MAG: hypothetical protein CAF45_013135 [Nitrospira sp. CG24E]|nr:MAG: hypothetical protein CAF45_013135 [Nitrospira sp. CG24E]